MKELPKHIQIFFWERIDQAIAQGQKQCEEYRQANKRQNAYLQYLHKSSTEQMRKVYLRWEEAQGTIASYENEWAYRQGLEDGIRLVQEIQSLRGRQ